MSRADGAAAAPLAVEPGLWWALRAAAIDFYYHSVRLVVANIAWGIPFFVVWSLAVAGAPVVALLAAPLLAIPWVGVVRLAALIARGEDVVLSDAFRAYRAYRLPALLAGGATTAGFALLAWNVVAGFESGGLLGWMFATLAGWGIAIGILLSLAFWPLLVDPRAARRPLGDTIRLAALVVLAYPIRMAGLGAVIVGVAAAATLAAAAIATIAVAWIALATCRVVLPLADRLVQSGVAGGRSAPAA